MLYTFCMTNSRDGSLGDGSLSTAHTQRVFDMDTDSDVLLLLKLVHQNPIDPMIKSHLRDLIFSYKQSKSSEDLEKVRQGFTPLRIGIKTLAADTSLSEEAVSQTQSKVAASLGTSRPLPRFTAVTVKTRPIRTVQEGEGVVMPARVESSDPVSDTATAAKTVQVSAPQPETVVHTQPEAVPVVVPSPASGVSNTERITEIKRRVNEKIGNPVNLIETSGDIGREYMNALLDAMKKSNGGTPEAVSEAMARLERAFAQVEIALNEGGAVPKQTPQVTEPPKVPEPAPAVAAIPHSAETQMPQAQKPKVVAMPVEPPAEAVPPVQQTAKIVPDIEVPHTMDAAAPSVERSDPQTIQESGMHSVAKEKQLQDLLRDRKEKEVLTNKRQEEIRIAAMDPLMAPDVNEGLSQLLSEWKLFKSSGIFGTGPSGKDHPLYKKIAPLTMVAVIAGRFEGASAPIKQSITDYMNGWRYEEGIVHEHGETFEHYLRRVVLHILNRQKRK